MLPVRLEICNFLAYQSRVEINFDGLRLACLSGPNGSGKSSLLDAMTWALWKESRARNDDKLLHIGQDEMYVIFEFRHEGVLFRVTRAYNRRKRGQSTLDLSVWEDNQFRSISDGSIPETQRKITQLLRLDYATFASSAFLRQGEADSFTSATPGKRKELLYQILGLSRWEVYEQRAKERLAEIDQELNAVSVSIHEKEREEAREPEIRQALAEAIARAEAIHQALIEAQDHLSEITDAPARLQGKREQGAILERRIEELEQDLNAIEAEYARYTDQYKRTSRLMALREEIEEGSQRLQSARVADDDMNDKRDLAATTERQISELAGQLDRLRTQLETERRGLEDQVTQAQREAREVGKIEAELERLHSEIAKIEAQRTSHERLVQDQKTLDAEETTLKTRNETLKTEGIDLNARLAMLNSAEARCPVCGQLLDAEQRDTLADEYQETIKTKREQYSQNLTRLKALDRERGAAQKQIEAIAKTLRTESKLRADEGKLQERLTKARTASERADELQAEVEARSQQLEAGSYAPELRAQIQAVQAELAMIGYDPETHKHIRAQIKELRKYDDEKHLLDTALEDLPGIEDAINKTQKRFDDRTQQHELARAEFAALGAEIEALMAVAAEAERRRAAVDRLRGDDRQANAERGAREMELRAVEMARRRKDELIARRDVRMQERQYFEHLRVAFSKNGVPAIIIEAAIPELETMTNELLARMTDGRMHIRFDTQRARKSGEGMIETLDILISDELGTRDYEMFSGGESFRINFALRVALSKFLARRAGARLQTLVIDEGFGSQDNVGRERLVEAINAIRDHFDLILIVTHIDELREAFPAHIEVRKTARGSEVLIR